MHYHAFYFYVLYLYYSSYFGAFEVGVFSLKEFLSLVLLLWSFRKSTDEESWRIPKVLWTVPSRCPTRVELGGLVKLLLR